MRKIYISGKISNLPFEEAKLKFENAEKFLKEDGFFKDWEIVNPMTIEHNHDKSWESYMQVDIAALLKCEAIYMLNNWGTSKGARIEYAIAKEMNLITLFEY